MNTRTGLFFNTPTNQPRPSRGAGWESKIKNIMNKLVNYIKASAEEMKKVTWPNKKETYQYTLLVIGISLAVAAFLGALDYIFSLVLKLIIK